jgi:hypothetical protein
LKGGAEGEEFIVKVKSECESERGEAPWP